MASTTQLQAFGMYERPGIGVRYPELVVRVREIVSSRIAALPWTPRDLISSYNTLTYQNPSSIVSPYPATGLAGQINPGTPGWLDTPEKRAAWNSIANSIDTAISAYAQGDQLKGAAELQRLRDNADFWDKVGNAIEGVGEFIGAGAEGAKKAAYTLVLIAAGAGLVFWYYKDPEGFKRFWGGLIPGKRKH